MLLQFYFLVINTTYHEMTSIPSTELTQQNRTDTMRMQDAMLTSVNKVEIMPKDWFKSRIAEFFKN